MITACQPLPQSVAEEMLQVAAKAICERPGDSANQRASRTRQMVYSILGFEPRDGLEYMLATMVVGHFQLILDSMHEALWGQMDSMKAKTKSGVVSLDRMMLGFVKELRLIRHRPLIRRAEDARKQGEAAPAGLMESPADSPAESPDWIAAWAGVARATPAAANTAAAPVPAAATPAKAEPARPATQTSSVPPATVPAGNAQAGTKPARSGGPLPVRDQTPGVTKPESRPDGHQPAFAVAGHPVASSPADADDRATEQHIAEFEAALASLAGSLEEARAFDAGKAKALSGD